MDVSVLCSKPNACFGNQACQCLDCSCSVELNSPLLYKMCKLFCLWQGRWGLQGSFLQKSSLASPTAMPWMCLPWEWCCLCCWLAASPSTLLTARACPTATWIWSPAQACQTAGLPPHALSAASQLQHSQWQLPHAFQGLASYVYHALLQPVACLVHLNLQ